MCSDEELTNLENLSRNYPELSNGVVDEDDRFSFELVAAVDPRLVAPVSFQGRFSVGLIPI